MQSDFSSYLPKDYSLEFYAGFTSGAFYMRFQWQLIGNCLINPDALVWPYAIETVSASIDEKFWIAGKFH